MQPKEAPTISTTFAELFIGPTERTAHNGSISAIACGWMLACIVLGAILQTGVFNAEPDFNLALLASANFLKEIMISQGNIIDQKLTIRK